MYIHVYQTVMTYSPRGHKESDTAERLSTAHCEYLTVLFVHCTLHTAKKRERKHISQRAQLLSHHIALVFMIST